MDPRLAALLARQHATRFSGLSGSDVRSVLRLSATLLEENPDLADLDDESRRSVARPADGAGAANPDV